MKKVILVGLLMIGFIGLAQNERGAHRQRENLRDLSPEQMATLQTKRMTLALDLSEAQQKQVEKINLEQATNRKAKMEDMKAKREERESNKPTTEERYALQNDMLDQQIAQKSQMKKILSKEQFEKWEKMHQKRQGARKGKRGPERIQKSKE